MTGETRKRWARATEWWIARNPMYLLSAGCMAIGARMLLVKPSARAGQIGLMLLTLGVLQAYEWAVATILVALHRSRRAPEDQPSVLLVAALFWTGPLAATAEMTARGATLDFLFAIAACAMAIAELFVVRRAMGLRMSAGSVWTATLCVVLLAIAPPLLKVPEEVNGTNEIFLYLCWWLLGGITLMSLAIARSGPNWETIRRDVLFCGLTVAATAAHLAAMNYAFFGHARWFYGGPLLIALSVVSLDLLVRLGLKRGWIITLCALPPAIAIVLARQAFHPMVPVRLLPGFLHDPLMVTLVLATMAWWFGYSRHGSTAMLHMGSASLAWAVLRGIHIPSAGPVFVHTVAPAVEATREMIVLALYALTVYLLLLACLRRSRQEALAAIFVHQAAVTCWVWGQIPSDVMIVLLAGGWHWLISTHLLHWRSHARPACWPVAFLILVSWGYDFSPALQWAARSHAALVVGALLLVGQLWPWTRYRLMASVAGGCCCGFYIERTIAFGDHAFEGLLVSAAFLLLISGACLSWHKRWLLAFVKQAWGEPPIGESP